MWQCENLNKFSTSHIFLWWKFYSILDISSLCEIKYGNFPRTICYISIIYCRERLRSLWNSRNSWWYNWWYAPWWWLYIRSKHTHECRHAKNHKLTWRSGRRRSIGGNRWGRIECIHKNFTRTLRWAATTTSSSRACRYNWCWWNYFDSTKNRLWFISSIIIDKIWKSICSY